MHFLNLLFTIIILSAFIVSFYLNLKFSFNRAKKIKKTEESKFVEKSIRNVFVVDEKFIILKTPKHTLQLFCMKCIHSNDILILFYFLKAFHGGS